MQSKTKQNKNDFVFAEAFAVDWTFESFVEMLTGAGLFSTYK